MSRRKRKVGLKPKSMSVSWTTPIMSAYGHNFDAEVYYDEKGKVKHIRIAELEFTSNADIDLMIVVLDELRKTGEFRKPEPEIEPDVPRIVPTMPMHTGFSFGKELS